MNTVILGAGFTGLAAAITSGGTAYEARDVPGGLGASYEKGGYRFEQAGGHWLFGGDPSIIGYIQTLTPCKRYERKASVYFPDEDKFYPYPIQATDHLQQTIAMETGGQFGFDVVTMKDALLKQFGLTLCREFFFPFNNLYTAGLYDKVAPQDAYKSPKSGSGYNVSFLYPKEGLGMLARKMAARCNVRFSKRAESIEVVDRVVRFTDGTEQFYDRLISTLPLNQTLLMTNINLPVALVNPAPPYTSVLVLNIGATKGKKCPDSHWVYVPHSESGFHRVGFYSNVDPIFAPKGKVAIYVERSFNNQTRPFVNWATPQEEDEWVNEYATQTTYELQSWGWIDEVEVVDPTFVPVAYTYRNVGSTWREDSLELLRRHDIHSVGRFGSWKFSGIMESIKEGFEAGCLT